MGKLKNRAAKTGFTRPTATVGNENAREWRDTRVSDLSEGDIIAQKGRIELITPTCGVEFYIQAGEDNELFLDPDSTVLAFVRKDS